MNNAENYLYSELTKKIIGCAYKVHYKLGAGFLEKLYENALLIELQKQGIAAVRQQPINVYYEGVLIGEYYADFLVKDKVIVELKALSELSRAHEVQLVNYLRATGMKVGLLINFGDKLTIRRKVMSK